MRDFAGDSFCFQVALVAFARLSGCGKSNKSWKDGLRTGQWEWSFAGVPCFRIIVISPKMDLSRGARGCCFEVQMCLKTGVRPQNMYGVSRLFSKATPTEWQIKLWFAFSCHWVVFCQDEETTAHGFVARARVLRTLTKALWASNRVGRDPVVWTFVTFWVGKQTVKLSSNFMSHLKEPQPTGSQGLDHVNGEQQFGSSFLCSQQMKWESPAVSKPSCKQVRWPWPWPLATLCVCVCACVFFLLLFLDGLWPWVKILYPQWTSQSPLK